MQPSLELGRNWSTRRAAAALDGFQTFAHQTSASGRYRSGGFSTSEARHCLLSTDVMTLKNAKHHIAQRDPAADLVEASNKLYYGRPGGE
jgi:hypothetical protein